MQIIAPLAACLFAFTWRVGKPPRLQPLSSYAQNSDRGRASGSRRQYRTRESWPSSRLLAFWTPLDREWPMVTVARPVLSVHAFRDLAWTGFYAPRPVTKFRSTRTIAPYDAIEKTIAISVFCEGLFAWFTYRSRVSVPPLEQASLARGLW